MTETLPTPAAIDATPTPAEATANTAAAPPPNPRRQGGRGRPQAKPQPTQARTPREVHPALRQLFTLYPKMFGAQFLPLKLGVFQDLLALHPDVFRRDELKVALGQHARSTRYLESVASGLPRHDLNGDVVEPVAPEHVHHAIMEVFRRRQARANQDLRPFAKAQLIEAIEASGLAREDYLLCVRQQDEVSTDLLGAAFAELAEQAAKRDALLRMFEASGKTVAEFADMYGMNPDDVIYAVERSRANQAALSAQAQAQSQAEAEALANEGGDAAAASVPASAPEEADQTSEAPTTPTDAGKAA